jgi:hypothetical protein
VSESIDAPIASIENEKRRGKGSRPQPRKHIALPDGDTLVPREELAAELGITDRSLRKLPLAVTYLGNIAYVARNKALAIVLKEKTRKPPPPIKARARR